jgi:GT2 family glycosyltransferase
MSDPPADAHALLAQRSQLRAAGDYAAADEVRERLRVLGWDVIDSPLGSTLRPALAGAASDLPGLLDQPATVDASLHLLAEDHADDLLRCIAGLMAHSPPDASIEIVVVANAPSFDADAALRGSQAVAIHLPHRLGWAEARNAGLRRSAGEVTILLDTSLEPTGDIVTPLRAAFDDPAFGIAGGWGVRSGDARHFEAAQPGEVDAVEAYCLAIRREALRQVRGFDHRFRFYRHADLDLSFAVRAAGWRAAQVPLPALLHEQRAYAALEPAERDRLSRRNFYRFLKHWGDRRDLLLEPAPAGGSR